MICEDNELLKDKVFFIIGKKDEQQLDEDIINKKVLRIIFQDDKDIKIPKINVHQELIMHYINLIHILFSYHKKKRKKLYNTKFINLKDEEIKNSIEYCQKLYGKVNIEDKFKKLYKIVLDSFVGNNNCLSDYIYSLIWNISFLLEKKLFLYLFYIHWYLIIYNYFQIEILILMILN